MATDSSPGSNIDIPSPEAAPTPKPKPAANPPAKKPADKKPASNGNGNSININTGDKAAAKPAAKTTAATNKPAANPVSDTKTAALKKAALIKPEGKTSTAKAAPPGKTAAKGKEAAKGGLAGKPAISTREELEELEKVGALRMMTLVPSWMISAIVHMVILLIFGLMLMPEKKKETLPGLVANVNETSDSIEEMADLQTEQLDTDVTEMSTTVDLPTSNELVQTDTPDTPAPTNLPPADIGIATAPAGDLLKDLTAGSGGTGKGSLSGRAGTAESKRASGATEASEAAVARALKWLAEHQLPDGSWSFDHTGGKCQGQCSHAGTKADARYAATGLALLPFLGAGHTHKQGKFKDHVRGGLYWLASNMKVTPNGGDMVDSGAMYGHGIASIALCEGYAMTQDKQLVAPAQASLNFIMYAQDPVGGGWNYSPRGAGDTSIAGWQIMALKSGHLGYLQVAKPTTNGAMKFLDSVQADGGAYYGYRTPGKGPATTAVGLLCRMYMGWQHDKPELENGVKYLASLGPQTGNMYFSYYATQVIHQFDGPDGDIWTGWNNKMRDSLVGLQSLEKHETGSWMFNGTADHGFEAGGRLYCTTLAAMTLEIYYRYMPIYTKKSSEDDFMD